MPQWVDDFAGGFWMTMGKIAAGLLGGVAAVGIILLLVLLLGPELASLFSVQ